MTIDVRIATNQEAWRLVADEHFLERWQELARTDPKLTLLQEPAFVTSWYRTYRDRYTPVVLAGHTAEGRLVGLLPLARRSSDGAVTHAGDHQAEYHGWIAGPEHDEDFLVQALLELRRMGDIDSWKWRWMPPGSPVGWASSRALKQTGIHVAIEERSSPVWDLTDPDKLEKVLGNRSIRAKINRYKRSGGYRFERVRDKERTRELIDVVAQQCDFRQEVVNAVRPFADDLHKAEFYVGRQNFPDANHFSVLWNGDRPIAFHYGGCDGTTCLLGLSAYAPSESRNSPGTLLIVELARSLTEEGYERLDLTPGTDPYKLRFANASQVLRRPTIYSSKWNKLKGDMVVGARGTVLRICSAQDLRVQDRLRRLQRNVGGVSRNLAHGRVGPLMRSVRNGLHQRNRYSCYTLEAQARQQPHPEIEARIHVQAYEDLLQYFPAGPHDSRREFLGQALERFAKGEVLYSAMVDGELAQIGWRTKTVSSSLAQELQQNGLLPGGSSLLHGFLTMPGYEASTAFRACLSRMLADCAASNELRTVLCLDRADESSRKTVEDLGFRGDCIVVHRRTLHVLKSWRVETGSLR